MRGATQGPCYRSAETGISIHAPHAGRDSPVRRSASELLNFNPRAPCGARHDCKLEALDQLIISIHAPHAGRDEYDTEQVISKTTFQSTRPMRGATAKVYKITLHTFATKGNSWTISRKTLPFKAFCRLQIGKNFSICGANRCGNFCELLLRTIRSSVLPEGRSACSQNAQFYSHTFSRDNRNADCLFPDP